MNDMHEDAIEALLRMQFDGPVPDDGFSEQVMQRLPPRRRPSVWLKGVGLVSGAGLCWLSLARAPLLHAAWHDWQGGEWSASAVVLLLLLAGISALAGCWCVSEADTF